MGSSAKFLSALAIPSVLLMSLAAHGLAVDIPGESGSGTLKGNSSNLSNPDVGLLPPEPSSGFSDFVPTTPFGEDTVPFEIFNSSDPKYMRRITLIPDPSEVRQRHHLRQG
jgi:hypothetical protein